MEDIVDLTKCEHNRIRVNNYQFLLKEAVEEVIDLYDYEICHKGIKLIKIINLGDVKMIYTDKKKIQRIINNLLGNALKYT